MQVQRVIGHFAKLHPSEIESYFLISDNFRVCTNSTAVRFHFWQL